jgi:hypothetical protein
METPWFPLKCVNLIPADLVTSLNSVEGALPVCALIRTAHATSKVKTRKKIIRASFGLRGEQAATLRFLTPILFRGSCSDERCKKSYSPGSDVHINYCGRNSSETGLDFSP